MSVDLVWITPNAEETIGYCARVSSPQNQGKDASRLLRYCIRHGHWSPFEMASMCVEIETTRAISAQILRHRSFSFQEFSQRYAQVQAVPEPPELRLAGDTNRQGSVEGALSIALTCTKQRADTLMRLLWIEYRKMIELGAATECARNYLPLCVPTRLYMSGTIRSWLHYTELRKQSDTQKEHREIAENIDELLRSNLPTVMEAMDERTNR